MTLSERQEIYEALRKFEGAIAEVAKKLHFTPDYVRNVMTRLEGSKSENLIVEGCCDLLSVKTNEANENLKKIFASVYSNLK